MPCVEQGTWGPTGSAQRLHGRGINQRGPTKGAGPEFALSPARPPGSPTHATTCETYATARGRQQRRRLTRIYAGHVTALPRDRPHVTADAVQREEPSSPETWRGPG